MFLHLLSLEQQQAFCRAVIHMVEADEDLHEREGQIKADILREVQLDSYPTDPGTLEQLLDDVAGMRGEQANSFLLELAGVATADYETHPEERRILEAVAARFGVPEDRIDQYVELAERLHRLFDDARTAIAAR
jgi:uncharacterized tellurite resistance protein B-like protein